MADVQCPMTRKIRPMSDCIACVNHVKNGTSNEWCGYRKPEEPKEKQEQPTAVPINALEMQMRKKLRKADYFYKTGKTRIANQLSEEAALLDRKIRRIKRDEEQNA
jgi:hypothetical protein